jgi:hypothetical protein
MKGRSYWSWTEKLSEVLRNHSVWHNTSVRKNRTQNTKKNKIGNDPSVTLFGVGGGRMYNNSHCQQGEH